MYIILNQSLSMKHITSLLDVKSHLSLSHNFALHRGGVHGRRKLMAASLQPFTTATWLQTRGDSIRFVIISL